ncbi:hypothetical protein FRB95_008502 [Tulasnella sp. JGI-2019a]|nr:hypothetical protein FRB95_008502 [Tulasnella sp. JGI-2019a]
MPNCSSTLRATTQRTFTVAGNPLPPSTLRHHTLDIWDPVILFNYICSKQCKLTLMCVSRLEFGLIVCNHQNFDTTLHALGRWPGQLNNLQARDAKTVWLVLAVPSIDSSPPLSALRLWLPDLTLAV